MKILRNSLIAIVLIAGLYCMAAYSSIPFIEKWRTLYIETAMSTMTHQWLATAFLPDSVVDEVVADMKTQMAANIVDSSEPISKTSLGAEFIEPPSGLFDHRVYFENQYREIDMKTMPETIDYSDYIQMIDIADKGIMTKAGDRVWAIDTLNKILIIEVEGDGYVGKLAIAKDSRDVKLAVHTTEDRGQTVTELCEEYGAVLGINGNGFYDPEGNGDGSSPVGLLISDGKVYNGKFDHPNYQIAGFDETGVFWVGKNVETDKLEQALQFYPITVLNGEKHADGSVGMGIQPRASIGQSKDGSAMFLVIDGRQVGHSLGTTVSECADILLRYDCQNAMNLDGGSSASMSYMGEMITKTSSPTKTGRWLPSAWVVIGEELSPEGLASAQNYRT